MLRLMLSQITASSVFFIKLTYFSSSTDMFFPRFYITNNYKKIALCVILDALCIQRTLVNIILFGSH